MPRIKRSCNSDTTFGEEVADEQMLRASWEYWETRGLENPSKRESDKIEPLKPTPRDEER